MSMRSGPFLNGCVKFDRLLGFYTEVLEKIERGSIYVNVGVSSHS